MSSPEIIVRISEIHVGVGSGIGQYYVWLDSFELKGGELDQFVHIRIPYGSLTKHQFILSPLWQGELLCKDLSALQHALFSQVIDASNHSAISSSAKRVIGYFVATMVHSDGSTSTITFSNVRISTLSIVEVKLGIETLWSIKFFADSVVYS